MPNDSQGFFQEVPRGEVGLQTDTQPTEVDRALGGETDVSMVTGGEQMQPGQEEAATPSTDTVASSTETTAVAPAGEIDQNLVVAPAPNALQESAVKKGGAATHQMIRGAKAVDTIGVRAAEVEWAREQEEGS